MKQIIKLSEQFGTRIHIRAQVVSFAKTLEPNNSYLLDFSGIETVSRSVADEFYTLVHSGKNVEIYNMSDFVRKMYDAVTYGRFMPRNLQYSFDEIIECPDMETLRNYLNPNSQTISNAFKAIGWNVSVTRENPAPGKQGSYHIKFHGGGDDRCVEVAQKLQDTCGFYCKSDWRSQIYSGELEMIDRM